MTDVTQSPGGYESRTAVQITAITEFFRAVRWAIITAGFVCCAWLVTAAAVNLLDKPPWLILSLAVLSGVVPSVGPTWIVIKLSRTRIKKLTARIAELEKTVNQTRSSSALRPDGTLPHD
jgi:hypothetical protein